MGLCCELCYNTVKFNCFVVSELIAKMILKYILCIAAFFALWMTVVSGRPMNDTLTSGLEGLQRVERATSDESPERKPADPDVLGMGFRNKRMKPREPKNREAKKF